MTVLFTDLVDSTSLAVRLGADTDQLRRAHFSLLRSAVAASGGTEVKTTGDGLMVSFESAAAAVACAVGMQRTTDRHNRRAPQPLGLRVGVAHGDTTIEDGDLYGIPVIEASRLCNEAAGGDILVTDLVRSASRGRADGRFEGLGRLTLKGFDEPVDAWRVCWDPATEENQLPPMLARHLSAGEFVGRDEQLELLDAAWERASVGELGAVLMAGEPGVGKTRLVAEYAGRVARDGARVLFGRADEQAAPPFGPFVSALRQLLEAVDMDVLDAHVAMHGAALGRLVPELAARVPDLPAPRQSDPDTERLHLREAVVSLLAAAAIREPILLVIDDLHWSDSASLGLLLHLLRGPEAPVMAVATYRASVVDQRSPLRASLGDLVREPRISRFELSGLSEADVAELLSIALGQPLDSESAELARRIHDETKGNALFATELLRHVGQSDLVERAITDELGIPPTIRDLVVQRLERIDPDVAHVLLPATILGPSFDADVLARVTATDEEALLDSLDHARQAGLIGEDGREPGRFFFTHAVIQAALRDTIGPSRRRLLHRRTAEQLEILGGSDTRRLGELATHWLESGDIERGREAAIRVGDAALSLLAPDEAARWYGRALEVHNRQEGPDQAMRAELLIRLGEAERRAGHQDFRAHLLEAGRLARDLGDADRLARAALANNRGMHSRTGRIDEERIELLEAAVEARGRRTDPKTALLLATTSSELWSGDHDRRHGLSDEALDVARRAGDDRVLAEVIYRRAFALAEPGTLQERLALTAELVALADSLGDPLLRLLASVERSRAAIESGDLQEAVEHAHRQGVLASRCGDAYGRHGAGWAQGWPYALAGRYAEAERAAEQALAESLESEQPDAAAFYGAQIAVIRWDQGRLGELADGILAHAEGPDGLPAHRALAALALAEGGRLDEAGRLIDAGARMRFALPLDTIWLTGNVLWGEACVLCGREDAAPLLLERLLPWVDQVAFTGLAVHGGVSRVAAELAALLEREDAGELFSAAEALHERLNAPAFLARTRAGWARWLASLGEAARARELAERAHDAADLCGCPHLASRAENGGVTAR
ncbi:MAG: AAA family ATPase [Thermoleophilaceae bacterium]